MTRTVLTTGANSGIGLATVVELARRGFRSVGSVRSQDKADDVAEAAAAAGVEVETVLLDVQDAERCRAVIDEVRPWGLVNNAGFGATGAIEDVSDDEARRQLETMVLAPMRLARLALPEMRAAGEGRVVNISSIMGRTSTPLTGWYQASKHALEAVTDAFRMEVAGSGVKVVLIEPGGFKTGIWDDAEADLTRRADSRYAGAYRRALTMTRMTQPLMGQPSQCAAAIARALQARSPRARYLVGYDARAIAAAVPFAPTAVTDRLSRLTLGL